MDNFMRITVTPLDKVSLMPDKPFSQWTLTQLEAVEFIKALEGALKDIETKALGRRIPIESWVPERIN